LIARTCSLLAPLQLLYAVTIGAAHIGAIHFTIAKNASATRLPLLMRRLAMLVVASRLSLVGRAEESALLRWQSAIRALTLAIAGVEVLICLALIYQTYAPSDPAGRGLADAIAGLAVTAGLVFVFPALVLGLKGKAPIVALGLVTMPLVLLLIVVSIYR
jgi:hypothetical protein